MRSKIKSSFIESGIWIFLLILTNLFFIFMMWLVSPNNFKVLVGLMVLFTLIIILVGLFFEGNKISNQEIYFERFLNEPNEENEAKLLNIFNENYIDSIKNIGDKLRSLEKEIKESEEKYLEHEDLIEGWIHEIKTPLHLGTLLLENRKDEMSPLVYKRFNHVIYRISIDLDLILYYARLQSSHINFKFKKVDINEITIDVIMDLNSLIKENNVSLEVEIYNKNVVTDEKTMKFILSQVIENALKYSKDKDKYIWIKSGIYKEDERIYLEIKDNGLGVEKQDLPFIFDKGFTGNYDNIKKSTGIGLYLVKKYCDLMKIDIEIDSIINKGFSIKFIFPNVK
ncbi:HAMP domain-containing histidine kinase [Clostridium sartagoforme]|uniref:histidine kinase n=1 Tax=Clostridium sartagoforme TaxID=84031 RepID=A0A4S2DIS3_9CLOT|nr:sensor histidine kinase [Clostridium sartagoforme]TGY42076.1 HAMP domain-containing histidine kinase [Clostridium sartagoforme]